MHPKSFLFLVAITIACTVASGISRAATLTLDPAAELTLPVLGLTAATAGTVTDVIRFGPSLLTSLTGSMTVTPVDRFPTTTYAVRFSLTAISPSNPLVVTGTYAPWDASVILQIDEMSWEFPASTTTPLIYSPLLGPYDHVIFPSSVTGTLRGSLTVGTTIVPFSNPSPPGCYSTIYGSTCITFYPQGGLRFDQVGLDRVVLGEVPGGSTESLAQFGLAGIVIDGVSFDIGVPGARFASLTYVPEPSLIVLLGAAGLALAASRRITARAS